MMPSRDSALTGLSPFNRKHLDYFAGPEGALAPVRFPADRTGIHRIMAKAAAKDSKAPKEKPAKGGSKMGLVKLVGFVLSILSAIIMVVVVVDFGLGDVKSHLHGGEKIAAVLLFLGVLLTAFAGSKLAAAGRREMDAALANVHNVIAEKVAAEFRPKEEALKELQADIGAKMKALEQRVDKFLGTEYQRLSAENESFRKDVEQRRQAEIQKTVDEIEQLRAKNLELQEKISKWAVEQVEIRIGEDKLNAA
jgi:Skp family chaperone for outer membrane proteins